MLLAIEETAKQWINDEVQSRSERSPFAPGKAEPVLQISPARWVLPKLLRIVYQNVDQPVEVLAPLIRSMLQEQAFASTGTDPCGCENLEDSIDETVAMMIRVLERVRRYCLEHPATG